MIIAPCEDSYFIRLDPGEQIVASITKAADQLDVAVAAVVSGVGMLAEVSLGFFRAEDNRYATTSFTGPFDLIGLQGNVFRRESKAAAHLHVTFNDPNFETKGGHLMEGVVHVTLELFLLPFVNTNLVRKQLAGCPATRVVLE